MLKSGEKVDGLLTMAGLYKMVKYNENKGY